MPDSLQLILLSAGAQQQHTTAHSLTTGERWAWDLFTPTDQNADAWTASASLQRAQYRQKHGRVETGQGCIGRDCFNGERIWNDTIWSERQLSGRKCPAGNVKFRAAAAQVKEANARCLVQHPINCFLVKSLAFGQATCPQWRSGLVPQTFADC